MNIEDLNFDDMSSGKISIPVTNPAGLFKETLVTALQNHAYLKVILSFQMEIMSHLTDTDINELNDRQKELYEQYFSDALSKIANKI